MNNIIEELKKARQMIDNETRIVMVSPAFAKKLIKTKTECPPTILFQLHSYVPENEALILQGELKNNVLKMYRDGLIKLYTLKELQDKNLNQ